MQKKYQFWNSHWDVYYKFLDGNDFKIWTRVYFLTKSLLGQKLRKINLVVQTLFSALSLANQTWIKLYKIPPIRRSEYKISNI